MRDLRPDTASVHEMQPHLARIRSGFLDKLTYRCMEIETLAGEIDKHGVHRDLTQSIAERAHKIAGVAPTLGFARLGSLSVTVDSVMSSVLTQDDWAAGRPLIESLLEEIETILETHSPC